MFDAIHLASLVLAALALSAPMAHLLELPNKLAPDGALWLAVQQHLYRGWGVVFGPVEILALVAAAALAAWRRRDAGAFAPTLVAVVAYAAMLAVYFAFNRPVNQAVGGWTADTLPPDWPAYRARWETGHALAAFAALVALLALIRARLVEARRPAGA
jgi:hypothetical protein